MQDNKKLLKILIPVVAVVVIIESFMLIKDLKAKKIALMNNNGANQTEQSVTTPVINLEFRTENTSMVLGKTYDVELVMTTNEEKMLDAFSTYIKYDKTAFDVSDLSYDKLLPTATFSKVSSDNGLIVNNIFISDAKGMKIEPSKTNLVLAKFKVKPRKAGEFTFEVDTGNLTKESVTMFIENTSLKVLPYESSKLKVSVSTQ